ALASAPHTRAAPRRPAAVPGRQVSVPRSRTGAPLGTAVDQARLGAAFARLAGTPVERLLARPELTAAQALVARGLPARTIDGFLRPLLAALLCDPDLTTSSRCADLALRAFARGRLCLPEGGAETLPDLLLRGLPPGTVHTGVRVTSVSTTSVTTPEHGERRCRAGPLPTHARSAAAPLPGHRAHRGAGHVRVDHLGDHRGARRVPLPRGARRDRRTLRRGTAAGAAGAGLPPGDRGAPRDRRAARHRHRPAPRRRPGRTGRP